jgi:hypothetical protein
MASSASVPDVARTTHLDIERCVVDFDTSTLDARVTYTVRVLAEGATEVVLDTKDLVIKAVEVAGECSLWAARTDGLWLLSWVRERGGEGVMVLDLSACSPCQGPQCIAREQEAVQPHSLTP